MSLAKALRRRFPIGACWPPRKPQAAWTPASHGSTFGGNPLAARRNAVLDVMLKPGFFDHVQKMSLLLKAETGLRGRSLSRRALEVRGEGFLSASRPWVPSGDLVNALRDRNCSRRRRRQCVRSWRR
jgi:acetylornithine/N-succinyldiaminopimelate aminotransferase